ncbi:CPBP family intramembrane glutamic endopeptidase [Pseudomaricurvus sp. HS19]|uniref:CPBP family intramembrane glutamic endopeptidase n=1 Tax=Pseudomaricurvus sp. HS19 TaxID=2692626 RepID=UPI00136B6EAB|nr:CPBP family intramembrane glutamic endopeptidase [Pseudomaricurvus sp. HS19]MYM64205.1 CPBP family intramembrane metalloprotease [Pseudomaricurvus sp. HS19]
MTKRIGISLVIYVAWIAVTLLGARLIVADDTTLNELVTSGIGWHFAAAIALLLTAISVFKWRDMHFTRPHSLVRTLWFPGIYLVLFASGVAFLGAPPLGVVVFVVINTLMVGVSEELMFRGVLFRALAASMSIWRAIIVTTVLFGAVHTLNVFITGELGEALVQSVAATMSGLVLIAIVIRTGSIWPAITYHFLWDCLLFLVSSSVASGNQGVPTGDPGPLAFYIPVLLNLPNFICALILLRHVGRSHGSTLQRHSAPGDTAGRL